MNTITDDPASFARLLRVRRTAAGLTQEHLATLSGLSVRAISDIERGRARLPRRSTMDLLARALDLAETTTTQHRGAAEPAPSKTWVPRQLPMPARHFTGRIHELKILDQLLDHSSDNGGVSIAAIDGMAGVGKTALAVNWAHQVADQFPDGQLYLNLRGFDPSGSPVDPPDAVGGFLIALGITPERIPVDPDAQSALYRSIVADRRILLVLDNARDVNQVRPLLPGSISCVAVVTSRHDLIGLVASPGAVPITLGQMGATEATLLLSQFIGPERLAAEPAAADRLVELSAYLPLALTIIGARAASLPKTPLGHLVTDLDHRLDALDTSDASTTVRTVFSWSYPNLSEAAARMLRLIAIHPGPDISITAAASLTGASVSAARQALHELAAAHLVSTPAASRVAVHDLIREYASERAAVEETPEQIRAAVTRVIDHYLQTVLLARAHYQPVRDTRPIDPPAAGVSTEDIADHAGALTWFESERQVLIAVISWAAAHGQDRYLEQIAWLVCPFFDRRGYWHEWTAIIDMQLSAAERLGDLDAQARTHHSASQLLGRRGAYREARTHLHQALQLYQIQGDDVGQARVHMSIGWTYDIEGNYRKVLEHCVHAADLYQAAGHRLGQVDALGAVGWAHVRLGNYQQSLIHCEHALDLYREMGSDIGQASTLDSIATAHHHLGHHAEAIGAYEQAIAMLKKLDDPPMRAEVQAHLGDTYAVAERLPEAITMWQEALATLDDLGHPEADQVRAKIAQRQVDL